MKKIAYGESFENFYEDGFIYIDKTKEIYALINYGRAFFHAHVVLVNQQY